MVLSILTVVEASWLPAPVLNSKQDVQTDLIWFFGQTWPYRYPTCQVARRHSEGDVLSQRAGKKGVQQPNLLPNLFLSSSIDLVKVCSIKHNMELVPKDALGNAGCQLSACLSIEKHFRTSFWWWINHASLKTENRTHLPRIWEWW